MVSNHSAMYYNCSTFSVSTYTKSICHTATTTHEHVYSCRHWWKKNSQHHQWHCRQW